MAKKAADNFFPNEKWKCIEEGIYLSPQRAIGKKSNYLNELRNAQILRDNRYTVFLVPEIKNPNMKNFDAIVNGMKFEFKNTIGGTDALQKRFLESRKQAPNVFINLEKSDLTKEQIISTLAGTRKGSKWSNNKNVYCGGKLILKIKGQDKLEYLLVDDLLRY